MLRVYLAGAIDLVSEKYAREWRESAIRLADRDFTNLEMVDPMEYEAADGPKFDEEIVNTDKFLISSCDALLVDGRQPGWGTPQEIQLAFQQNKLIVVFGIDREKASIWLRYHASHFAPTLTEAVEHLYAIAGGERV